MMTRELVAIMAFVVGAACNGVLFVRSQAVSKSVLSFVGFVACIAGIVIISR